MNLSDTFYFLLSRYIGVATKTPICSVCLKSDILCLGCKRKLEEGKISPLDVKISRALFELAQKYRGLDSITFKRAIEVEGLIVLLVGRGEINIVVGKGGRIVRKLDGSSSLKGPSDRGGGWYP
jgi:transcription antitermination factor NusA-like protein